MLQPQADIEVTLRSNVPPVPGNKPSNYKTVLPTSFNLDGAWEIAQHQTHYPHQIPNFKATTLVVICSVKAQSDNPKHIQPEAYQSPRGQTQGFEFDGYCLSTEEDEDLDIGPKEDTPSRAPQHQTDAETMAPKDDEKKSEHAINVEDPEAAKKETLCAEKRRDVMSMEELKKPEDANTKKANEDATKNTKEDAEAAQNKAEEDAAKKKAEAKRHEESSKHIIQPLYILAQAGVQFMKDNTDLGKNGMVNYIPGLYY